MLESQRQINHELELLQNRMLGAYIGLAIGDALGATTEFLTPREIKQKYATHRHIIGGGWLNLQPGQVTDDTEMSLALGESILEQGSVQAQAVAQAFSDWMRSKPIDIGNTVRRGIVHFRHSGEAMVPVNEYDAGNGACMRCLPIAILHYNSPWKLVEKSSRIQSHVTHNNPVADAGTETLLKMTIGALHGESKSTLKQYTDELIAQFPCYEYQKRKVENPSGWLVETLQSVFQAFYQQDGFSEVLVDVVNRGGDSDTTGAIAGMLAGAFYSYDAIPTYWIKKLDKDILQRCTTQTLQLLTLNSQLPQLSN